MPIVPITKRDLSGPAPVFRTTAGVTQQAFGVDIGLGSVGKAIDSLAEYLFDVNEDERIAQSKRRAKTADADFTKTLLDIYFGTEDTDGYGSLDGQLAVDAAEDTFALSKAAREGFLESLSDDPLAAEAFFSSSNQTLIAQLGRIKNHQLTQRGVADSAASKARMDASVQAATKDPSDNVIERELIVTGTEALSEFIKSGVVDTEAEDYEDLAAGAVLNAQGALLKEVIISVAATNPDLARNIRDSNVEFIPNVIEAEMETIIRTGEQALRASNARDAKLAKDEKLIKRNEAYKDILERIELGKEGGDKLTKEILEHPDLDANRGDQGTLISLMKVRAKGRTVEEMAATERAFGDEIFDMLFNDIPSDVIRTFVQKSDIEAFGPGGKLAVLKLLEPTTKDVEERRNEYLFRYRNGENQIRLLNEVFRDNLLSVDHKKAFEKYFVATSEQQRKSRKYFNESALYAGLFLDPSHPDYTSDEMLQDPNIINIIDFATANQLTRIKEAMLNPVTKKEEDAKKIFFDGMKGRITFSVLGAMDQAGNEHFSVFMGDINRIVEDRRAKDEDVMILFDARTGNNEYLGRDGFMKTYLRTLTQQSEAFRHTLSGDFTPFLTREALPTRPLTAEEFLNQ